MKFFIAIMCWVFGFNSFAADVITLEVDKKSQVFVVSLPANPTTGFEWTLINYDKKLLHPLMKHYSSKKTKLIGSGGDMTFSFGLNKGKTYPATTKLVFCYERSWEKSSNGSCLSVIISFLALDEKKPTLKPKPIAPQLAPITTAPAPNKPAPPINSPIRPAAKITAAKPFVTGCDKTSKKNEELTSL